MPPESVASVRLALQAAVLLALAGAGELPAATITVNSTSDLAVPKDGLCTLREAIDTANINGGPQGADCGSGDAAPVRDVIEFAIPGPGVHTILVTSLLPEVTETVFIDGYSQPGASPNTLAFGSDAVLSIQISGSLMPHLAACATPPEPTQGILLAASDCEVRGLAIGAFVTGIREAAGMGVQRSVVAGNFLGTDASGRLAIPNSRGVLLHGRGSRLGGPAPADRNVISANLDSGAVLQGSDLEVLGNYIGLDSSGTVALPNGEGIRVQRTGSARGRAGAGNLISGNVISGNVGAGIQLTAALDTTILGNWIGTDGTGTDPVGNGVGISTFGATGSEIGNPANGNVIAFNDGAGILIGPRCLSCLEPNSGHRISANSIHANGGLGIDLLGLEGVDVEAGSDPLDADDLQNRPVLVSAADDGILIHVPWSLDGAPETAYAVEFFYGDECDPSGAGEGEIFLGAERVTTDATGSAAGRTRLATPGGAGVDSRGRPPDDEGRRRGDRGGAGAVTATAIDLDNGDTSEFSDCVVVGEREARVREITKPAAVDLRSLGLEPLAEERVSWLLEKIARGERVEPEILHAALIGPQMALRADAARILAQWGDASSIPHLIHALTDESSHVGAEYADAGMATTRYWAARSLREMTGRDLGFVWDSPLDQRNAAVLRWLTWCGASCAD